MCNVNKKPFIYVIEQSLGPELLVSSVLSKIDEMYNIIN